MIPPAYTFLIGDYRSVVDRITQEFMKATDRYRANEPFAYELSEETSWHCCRMEMRDQFMTYGWINHLYHEGDIRRFRTTNCAKCRYETPEILCDESDQEVETCWQREQDRIAVEHYAQFWESE